MTRPTICMLGCGKITRLHSTVARTLRRRFRLAYASRSLERAMAYNRQYRGAGAFGSYEDACSSPEVDAVFVCTPHACHVDHVTLAAEAGKPTLVEKPVTRTLDEWQQIRDVTTRHRTPCMVAENYFFKPLLRTIRFHLERGDIGHPLFVEINKTGISRNTGWRTDPDLMGGGALLEGGVHWVNLLLEIAGPPREVLAARPDVDYPRAAPFEDNLEVLVRFASGAVGKLLHSWRTHNRIFGLSTSKIYGTEGNITFESNGIWALVLGRRTRIRIPGLLDIMGYRSMLKAFADVVTGAAPVSMSLEVARRDLALIDGAYRSLESGRWEVLSAAGSPS